MPPLDAETMAMLNYYLASQTNLDPTMQSMLGGLISPNVDKRGNLDQFGVDLEKTNLNQYQDITGTFGNPMNTLLSGLGATGPAPLGGGVVGGGGLNPITTESIMDTPATLRFTQLAQRAAQGGQVTPETYIASMLVNQQADPSVIVADLQAKMADPSLDAATKNLFSSWLPRIEKKDMQGNPTGEFVTDWNAAAGKIEKAAEPFLNEQAAIGGPNVSRNNYGQYVSLSEQPSEMMQYLQKLGLPDPRAQYGVDFSVQSDPQLAELMTSIGAKGQAFDQARQTYEKYLKDRPIAQGMARRAEEMGGTRKEQYANDMAKYVKDMAAYSALHLGEPSLHTQEFLASRPDPGGAPGWMKALGGAIGGAASDVGQSLSDSFMRAAGSRPPGPGGRPTLPSNVGPLARTPEMARPTAPTLRGPGLLEQMYAKMNTPDQQYALAGQMNAASKAQGEDMLAMVRAIAPSYGAARAGRSPFKDAIMQRLQPILAAGGARR
jgi:hypothetical protein